MNAKNDEGSMFLWNVHSTATITWCQHLNALWIWDSHTSVDED